MSNTDVVVEINSKGTRIDAYSRWFVGVSEMFKSVPGHTPVMKNGKFSHWSFPLTMQSCLNLRRVFTDMLIIGPELAVWARDEKARQAGMRSLGKRSTADLAQIPDLAPRMAQAMTGRTYQRVGARFIAEGRRVLLADEPTLGKTLQVYGGLIEAGIWPGHHLIVAPKSALETAWYDELHLWTDGAEAVFMPEGKARRIATLDYFIELDAPTKFLIINPEMLQVKIETWCHKCQLWEKEQPDPDSKMSFPKIHFENNHAEMRKVRKMEWPWIIEKEWRSITVDEAHKYLLGIRSNRKKTQVGEGFMRLRTEEGGCRIAVTGTPIKGNAKNFWSVFHWLDEAKWTSPWAYYESYLELTNNGFGTIVGDVNPLREQELYTALDSVMLRRTKKEVQPELPEMSQHDHWVSMSDAQQKQYDSIYNEGEASIDGVMLQTTGLLAEFTRLKQLSFGEWTWRNGKLWPKSSPKAEWLLAEFARRNILSDPSVHLAEGSGWKYVVASQFTGVVDWIADLLESQGIHCLKITGSVTGSNRTAAQREFQSGDPASGRVLVINTLAGGAAITLDAWCDEMFVMDETWVRDEQIQLEGRINNRDPEKRIAPRVAHYIRTKNSVEEEIAKSGLTQDEFQKTLLDRRRGVTLRKRVLDKED